MAVRAITIDASQLRRRNPSTGAVQSAATDNHLVGGSVSGQTWSGYLRADLDWDQVKQIISAELFLTGASSHGVVAAHRANGIALKQIVGTVNFTSETGAVGENNFHATSNRPTDSTATPLKGTAPADGVEEGINITRFFDNWAPKSVKKSSGGPGGAQPNRGIHLFASAGSLPIAVDSTHAPGGHPRVVLTYVEVAGPGETVLTGPAAIISQIEGEFFEGSYIPGAVGVVASRLQIELYDRPLDEGPILLWQYDSPASASMAVTGDFTVPLPELLTSGLTYYWRARVTGSNGIATGWAGGVTGESFELLSSAPTLTDPQPDSLSFSTLTGVLFSALYAGDQPADTFQIQARVAGEPTWNPVDLLWDSGEQTAVPFLGRIGRNWAGPGLDPDDYEWRIRARNSLGALSAWVEAAFTLTQGWKPDPGDEDFLTGYARRHTKARILIKALDIGDEDDPHNRAPLEPPIAIIEDASNVGGSEFYNDSGEFFFTLPAIHPQAHVIEPYQVAYCLELYRDEGWKEITSGLIVDVDSTGDEVIWYGTDWEGILGRTYDERFSVKGPDVPISKGGGKYVNQTVSDIIVNQLQAEHDRDFSPLAFIAVPAIADWVTKITINASFKQRLQFIAGLMDSHRAGTGRRTRLSVRKLIDGTYTWDVQDSPGRDRENIVLEYGGIVQGFQVIPFEGFSTKVLGVGRKIDGSLPIFSIGHPPDNSGTGKPFPEWRYGSFPTIAVWQDIVDPHDLTRRTQRLARQTGKIGKRVALALRVGALDVKDGWDICDSVSVIIQRGVIDTTRYGSGFWTIVGWAWRLYPDGHTDLILSLVPRDDNFPPDTTILSDGTTIHDAGPESPGPTLDVFVRHCTTDVIAEAACQFFSADFSTPSATDWGADWTEDSGSATIAGGQGLLAGPSSSAHHTVSPVADMPWDVRVSFESPSLTFGVDDVTAPGGHDIDIVNSTVALTVHAGGVNKVVSVGANADRTRAPDGDPVLVFDGPGAGLDSSTAWGINSFTGELVLQRRADGHLWGRIQADGVDSGFVDLGVFTGTIDKITVGGGATQDDSTWNGGTLTFDHVTVQKNMAITSVRLASTTTDSAVACWRFDDDLPDYHGLGSPDNTIGIDGDLYYEEDTGDEWIKQTGVWVALFDAQGHRVNVFPQHCTEPVQGQWVVGEFVSYGDGATVDWTSDYPYRPDSLYVYVDGLPQEKVETDPAAQQFQTTFAPEATEAIQITYVVDA